MLCLRYRQTQSPGILYLDAHRDVALRDRLLIEMYSDPESTQYELAGRLKVSQATILRRVGDEHFAVFHRDPAAACSLVTAEIPVGVADYMAVRLLINGQHITGALVDPGEAFSPAVRVSSVTDRASSPLSANFVRSTAPSLYHLDCGSMAASASAAVSCGHCTL